MWVCKHCDFVPVGCDGPEAILAVHDHQKHLHEDSSGVRHLENWKDESERPMTPREAMNQTGSYYGDNSILLEAHEVVRNRRDNYGGPQENFKRIAAIWSQILGGKVTTTQVGLMMIGLKIARHCHKPVRDNLVDIAGYADCIAIIEQETTNGKSA